LSNTQNTLRETQTQLSNKDNELKTLQNNIQILNTDITKTEKEIKDLNKTINDIDSNAGTLYNYINNNLIEGKNLDEIKKEIHKYIDDKVIRYCYSNVNFIKEKYNKIKLDAYSNDNFELVLICWDKNSETKIHDHPSKGCILYLLSGKLEEKIFNKSLKNTEKTIIEENDVSYMHNTKGYHKIRCIEKAISLHIYSPVNYKINTF
jgi:chaperonin cofactor prefoldin